MRIVALALCVVALATQGCASGRRGSAQEPTIVEVTNHSFPDVVIYAVSSGDPHRLGMVTGNGTAKFTINASFLSAGMLQIMARPIAGRAFLLPAVSAGPGDVVEVVIESTPAQSHVQVTPAPQ